MKRHILLGLLVLGIMLVLSNFVSATFTSDEIISCYDFDVDSVTEVDQKGNFNLERRGDPVFGTDSCILGSCYFFDGDGDFFVNGSHIDPDTQNDGLAICFWINVTTGDTAEIGPYFWQSDGSSGSKHMSFPPDNKWNYQYGTGGGTGTHVDIEPVAFNNLDFFCTSHNTSRDIMWKNATEIDNSASGTLANGGDGFGVMNRDGGGNFEMTGYIDQMIIINKTGGITLTEVQDIYNGGAGRSCDFYISGVGIGAPATPTIVAPSPADASTNNTNVTLNVTHNTTQNDVRYYLYFGTNINLNETHLQLNNVTRTGDEFREFLTNVSDGTYFWKWKVQNITLGNALFSGNTTQRTWTLDTITPVITLNNNNAFNNSNISSHNQYLDFMFINITVTDETDLFAFMINITKDGVTFFNHTNSSLTGSLVHNFTDNLSTSSWPDGVFDIEISVSDTHTTNLIDDYDISRFLSRITFDTPEGNKIDIIGSGAISTEYSKQKDRYEFGFNYLTSETSRKFTVKCNNNLFYLPNSNFNGHFVCWNSRDKTGNWVDFEGIGEDYTVKKIKDREYEVSFINLPSSKKVSLKSIGGLNIRTENYQWFKGSTSNIFTSPATSGSEQSFELNISLDFDLVDRINVTFEYNDTVRTISRTESASSILFSSTFDVPDVEETLNLSWIVNITQRDNHNYSFSLNSTQSLVSPQVNLTILDEENQSLILEDLTIFFTGPSDVQTNTSSGNLLIGNLTLGEYFISVIGNSYPQRGIFFTVTNASISLNLYLVFDEVGNDFIDYFIQDIELNRIEDARMTFQKNINGSFITMAQLETDFAGQARIFQDQQNEYNVIITHPNFPFKEISLIPIRNSYTITLDTANVPLFDNIFEGIRYVITPAARVLNSTNTTQNISFSVFDPTSSLEFFGLEIVDSNFTCTPADCIGNITGSPAGGTTTVGVLLNGTGEFAAHFFIKRNGFDLQFINKRRWGVDFLTALIGKNIVTSFTNLGEQMGTPVMRSIFAAILITTLCALASQMGVVGLGLVFVAALGNLFFMLLGFIDIFIGLIIMIFALSIYFVLGRNE